MWWVSKFEESPSKLSNDWRISCLKDLCIKIKFSSAVISWNLRILQSLKRGLVGAFLLKEKISLNDFIVR